MAANYTWLAGWAKSFLTAGAGAFIGSLWEVRDSSAGHFAEEFYRSLLGGVPLGYAMKQARTAIQNEPGDPTWLAYTLYGNPSLVLSKGGTISN
jgi:CHAT domain-containing protein